MAEIKNFTTRNQKKLDEKLKLQRENIQDCEAALAQFKMKYTNGKKITKEDALAVMKLMVAGDKIDKEVLQARKDAGQDVEVKSHMEELAENLAKNPFSM